MTITQKIFGGLTIALSLFSCTGKEETPEIRPFTNVANFKQLASKLDSNQALIKRLEMANKVETKQQSTTHWPVELKPFINADFNRAIYAEKYVQTTQKAELANQTQYTFTSTDNDLPVQKAIYRYENEQLIAAKLWVNKASKVYTLSEVLSYFPNIGYNIDNTQDLQMVREESFFLEAYIPQNPQPWRMFFDIGQHNIPVNFFMSSAKGQPTLTFVQGKEKITVTARPNGENWIAEMPVFNSYIEFSLAGDALTGTFHNLDRGTDYIIPFTANKLDLNNYLNFVENKTEISGKWETYFESSDGSKSPAIGIFNQIGSDVYGTFATETGDYRFLQGQIMGDSFSLSTFDGSHLYLFTAKINGDSIVGKFYSGNHYSSNWSATKNDQFELANPDEMTQLQNIDNGIEFAFPNLEKQLVRLSDNQFKGKPVIIQLLGSWCPNCMDETRYFVDLYNQRNSEGLEIIGLAFERSEDFNEAKTSLEKSISDLNVPYTMLIAGTTRNSAEKLPFIDKIKSYPTSIFLDKNHQVIKVHTGFYGPGTGQYYSNYVKETNSLIDSLLAM